jgi:hypothetical protein
VTLPPPAPPPGVGQSLAYEPGKQQAGSGVVWRALTSIGFSETTGNSNVVSLSGSGLVSRDDGSNKIALSVEGVFALSQQIVCLDIYGRVSLDPNCIATLPSEVGTKTTTLAAFFLGKLRYDRFLTPNNSLYITGLSGFDQPADIVVTAQGQAGYSRMILKTKMHQLSAELGYDFTWDRLAPPLTPPMGFVQDIFLHSGRGALSYMLAVSDHTSLHVSAETLINLNLVHIGDRDVYPAQASRVNGKVEFTTKIWKPLAFRAAFTVRYNNAPTLNSTINYDPNNPLRYNQPLDTLTELGLVMQFL